MGYDVTGRLLDIFTATVIMFFVPLVWFLGGYSFLKQEYASMTTRQFVQQVCTNGSIKPENYEAYIYRMGCVGEVPDIRMTRKACVLEPVYADEMFTGEVVSYESVASGEQILSGMYKHGVYEFNPGDEFTVEYCNRIGTFGTIETGLIEGKTE